MNTKIQVFGMTCQHCINSVTEELMKLSGVKHVEVSLDSGDVDIESDHELKQVEIEFAVTEAGYTMEMN